MWSEFGVVRINGTAQGYEQSIDFGQKTKKIFLEAPIQDISGNVSGVLFRELDAVFYRLSNETKFDWGALQLFAP